MAYLSIDRDGQENICNEKPHRHGRKEIDGETYAVFENEDGSFDINLNAGYYGEIDYNMQYRDTKGESFDWLYIDFDTLSMYAERYGFKCEKCINGEHYDYLARLVLSY